MPMNRRLKALSEGSTATADRFRAFKPETEQRVRKLDVREDEVQKQLLALFKEPFDASDFEESPGGANAIHSVYIAALWESRRSLCYTARDVELLSLSTKRLYTISEKEEGPESGASDDDIVALYLSALVNFGPGKNYRIISAGEDGLQNSGFAGYRNTKNLEIIGEVGGCVGKNMKGGRIVLKGDFNSGVGMGMTGGEIHLFGEPKDHETSEYAEYVVRGKIFHNGKLIVSK